MKNQLIVAVLAIASLGAVACAPAETNTRPATTTSASAPSAAVSLDGRTFTVDSAKLPDGSQFATELSFAGGMIHSSACEKLGYAPGKYTATREGNVIAFRAEMKKGDETEVWTGRITGDAIEANATVKGQALAWQGRAAK
jgi:hypothetical protein